MQYREPDCNLVLVMQTDALHPPAVNVLNVLAGSVQVCVLSKCRHPTRRFICMFTREHLPLEQMAIVDTWSKIVIYAICLSKRA